MLEQVGTIPENRFVSKKPKFVAERDDDVLNDYIDALSVLSYLWQNCHFCFCGDQINRKIQEMEQYAKVHRIPVTDVYSFLAKRNNETYGVRFERNEKETFVMVDRVFAVPNRKQFLYGKTSVVFLCETRTASVMPYAVYTIPPMFTSESGIGYAASKEQLSAITKEKVR